MDYIDGFVAAVPTDKRDDYLKHASTTALIFKKHGATRVTETWGDDVPEGKLTSFSMAVQRKPEETVVFSWIVWPSRAVRDEAWKKIMEEPSMQPGANPMPFDGKRMIFGGFQMIMDI